MLVKDIMVEKQLNFNQPILSVRRFSSKVASETNNKRNTNDNSLAIPSCESEIDSGSVRNAGNIPFVWEKTPGKPKDVVETKLQSQSVEKAKQQDSGIDGRTESNVSNSKVVASLDEKVTKEGIEEKESCESDDGDETFLDALDTLSRTESFFMSCNLSGLNGWDDQESEVQSSGSFSSDKHARDFMIDRFLPAAKAVISETPQKQLNKVASTERLTPLNQHEPKSLRHYIQDIGKERIEEETDDSENYTTAACGLFPPLCLLNPIPGVRMEDKVQSNAGLRMQAKSTSSHTQTTKENARPPYQEKRSADSRSGFTNEKEILGILENTKTSCESPLVEKTLYVDSVHRIMSQTNHKGDDFETLDRDNINSGPYKNLSVDSSLENSQRMDIINVKAALQAKISESLDKQMEVTNHSMKMVLEKLDNQGGNLDQDLFAISSTKMVDSENRVSSNVMNSSILIQKSEFDRKSIDQECTLEDGKIDLENQCVMKLGNEELYDATSYFEIPLVLPTLKAPSESWLKKTLSTISSRNISSKPNLCAKVAKLCPKWETIGKSSNVHHGNMQLHEELLKPIAEE